MHASSCDGGKFCIETDIILDAQFNMDVTILIRMIEQGGELQITDYIEIALVQDPESGNNVEGWTFSVDSFRNLAELKHSNPDVRYFYSCYNIWPSPMSLTE